MGNVIAQILLATDSAQYLPVAVTTAEGFPIQTAKARLKRSLITGKYILFGSGEENDQLVRSEFPCEPTVNVQMVGGMTGEEIVNFHYPDPSDECFLSSFAEIVDIGTDTEADEQVEKEIENCERREIFQFHVLWQTQTIIILALQSVNLAI